MGPLLASCHRDCSLRQCETDVFFKTHHGLILSHHRLSTQSTKPLGWGGEVGFESKLNNPGLTEPRFPFSYFWFYQMVNGLHLYSAFLTSGHSKRFTIFTHSHTDGGVSHARRQPAHREQLGRGVLLRDTSTLATSNLPVISQPALPPVPHAAPL